MMRKHKLTRGGNASRPDISEVEALGRQSLAEQKALNDKMRSKVTYRELYKNLQPLTMFVTSLEQATSVSRSRCEAVIAFLSDKFGAEFDEFFTTMMTRYRLWESTLQGLRERPPATLEELYDIVKNWHAENELNPRIKIQHLGDMVFGLLRGDLDLPKETKIAFLREISVPEDDIEMLLQQLEEMYNPEKLEIPEEMQSLGLSTPE